jgi:hypothetical protein
MVRSCIDESERFHGIGTLAGVIDRAVQLAGEIVGKNTNAWLHAQDRAAAEGLIDNTPQARMVWLIHG